MSTLDNIVIEYQLPDKSDEKQLNEGEIAVIEGSSSLTRRKLFCAGRISAHRALFQLDAKFASIALLKGESGEPLFPKGIVGSISHCDSLACAAVSKSDSIKGLGIDVEHSKRRLSARVIERIMSNEERECYKDITKEDSAIWIRLFCAKEALFKACFQYIKRDFGFSDVSLLFSSPDDVHIHPSSKLKERLDNELNSKWQLTLSFKEYKGNLLAIAILN
jgi:4'-phosphopantetheinyl transferase EntD